MSYGEAAILGFVQGMTEFLPVSSSAHLKLVPWLAGWNYQGLAYDIALHWGTLLALAAFFWKDWLNLLAGAAGRGTEEDKGLFWRIFWATAPAGFAGLLLEDYAEAAFGLPARTAAALIVFGVLMGWADRSGAKTLGREGLTMRNCLFIGCAQALALIPGVSRSGITITTGLLLGLKREEAARFSFLLSTPIVFAAGALKLRDCRDLKLCGHRGLGAFGLRRHRFPFTLHRPPQPPALRGLPGPPRSGLSRGPISEWAKGPLTPGTFRVKIRRIRWRKSL